MNALQTLNKLRDDLKNAFHDMMAKLPKDPASRPYSKMTLEEAERAFDACNALGRATAYEDALNKIKNGLKTVSESPCQFEVRETSVSHNDWRQRYFVACRTCRLVLHESTRVPVEWINGHLRSWNHYARPMREGE